MSQKNNLNYLHNNCQKNLWTLLNSILRFVTLHNTRKIWPKSFLHWKVWRLLQKIAFCPIILWTLIIYFLRLVKYDITGKGWSKSFFQWNNSLFWKFAFSAPYRVLIKWSFNFHSEYWNTLWTLINCFLRFLTFDTRKYEKKIGQIHFHREDSFFEMFFFLTPS